MKLLLTALSLAVLPSVASAQIGGTFSLRSVNGEETDVANSDRRGADLRLHYDRALSRHWGWRAEIAGVQMTYQRDIPGLDRRRVSENGFEASVVGTGRVLDGALAGTYAVIGPVSSYRANCGVEGGFVDCDATPRHRLGYAVGVGFATPLAARRELLFEVRFSDATVAAAGASVLSLGVGVRSRNR